MQEYLEVTGTVLTFTDKAVLLSVGKHQNKVWLPYSTLETQPTFTRGEQITVGVSERFLAASAYEWLLSNTWEDYDGN